MVTRSAVDQHLQLLEYVPSDKPVVFICIGTDRSTGDAYGPLVGTKLKEIYPDIPVFGTIDEPVHAVNIAMTVDEIKFRFPNHSVIAIDASLGKFDHIGWIFVDNEPTRPGAGVNKNLPEVGDVSISAVVNVAGFMEYFVLQNTRLSQVMGMVNRTVSFIGQFLEMRQPQRQVATSRFSRVIKWRGLNLISR